MATRLIDQYRATGIIDVSDIVGVRPKPKRRRGQRKVVKRNRNALDAFGVQCFVRLSTAAEYLGMTSYTLLHVPDAELAWETMGFRDSVARIYRVADLMAYSNSKAFAAMRRPKGVR
jgi:hypothetical protein